MVPFAGKPLLQHHLEYFRQQGITEFVLNLHHRPEKITEYFGDGSQFGVKVTYSLETEIRGTAGGVKQMEAVLRDGTFLVIYGDNLIRVELAPLVEFHRQRRAIATVALFKSPEPWTGGVVETDATGKVTAFREKPDRKTISTNRINAGIYLLEPAVLDFIPAEQFCDFGKDVFPKVVGGSRRCTRQNPGRTFRTWARRSGWRKRSRILKTVW